MEKELEHKKQAKKLAEVYNITDRKSVWWTEVKGETKLTEYDPQKDKK